MPLFKYKEAESCHQQSGSHVALMRVEFQLWSLFLPFYGLVVTGQLQVVEAKTPALPQVKGNSLTCSIQNSNMVRNS